MSVKALIDFVLEKVAIDGEPGTTVHDLFKYVGEFYHTVKIEKKDIVKIGDPEAAATTETPAEDVAAEPPQEEATDKKQKYKQVKDLKQPENNDDFWGAPMVKEEFQDHIWNLLKTEKEFIMGEDNCCAQMSLMEVVEKCKNGTPEERAKMRVYTTIHQRWMVIAGHPPDPKRVPNALYKCLEEIARHGEKGIIQPELTKITKQDKRSIAGRTTQLADQGYIEKIAVLVKGMNTSRLTLTKFAAQRDYKEELKMVTEGTKNEPFRKSQFTGDVIMSTDLVKAVIKELKNSKSGVILRQDLKVKLGMDKSRFHSRTFSRLLRRVECTGVWRRILVPLQMNRKYRSAATNNQDVIDKCHARCLKFVRDITEEDWKRIGTSTKPAIRSTEDDDDDGGDESDAEAAKDMKALEADEAAAVVELAAADVEEVEEEVKRLPLWTPDVPMVNIMQRVIDEAGTKGLASMELMQRVVGSFYYRPLDQILHRLTDHPWKSQPQWYISLGIIRETSISHRQTHYRYFSYTAHQKLVQQGLASDPFGDKPKLKGSKTLSSVAKPQKAAPIEYDQYGFPLIDISKLEGGTGKATLQQSQQPVLKKEQKTFAGSTYYTITKGPDGQDIIHIKPIGSSGRPRKYEKGKEPYLEARRRRESLGLPPLTRGRPKTTPGPKRVRKPPSENKGKMGTKKGRPTKAALAEAKRKADELAAIEQAKLEAEKKAREDAAAKLAENVAKQRALGVPEVAIQSAFPLSGLSPSSQSPPEASKTLANAAAKLEPVKEVTPAPDIPPEETPQPTPMPAARDLASMSSAPGTPTPATPHANPPPQTPSTAVKITPVPTPTPRQSAHGKRQLEEPATPIEPGSKRTKKTIRDFFTPIARATPSRETSVAPAVGTPTPTERTFYPLATPTQTRHVAFADTDMTDAPAQTELSAQETPSQKTSGKRSAKKSPPSRQSKRLKNSEPGSTPLTMADLPPIPSGPLKAPDWRDNFIQESPVLEESTPVEGDPEITPSSGDMQLANSEDQAAPSRTVDGTLIEIEPMDQSEKNYNLLGGMLALGRQQVVLELLKDHGGCFPGGLELLHAFNKRYRAHNDKAGDSDRRLVRSVVQSLQYKGKINQVTFTFMNSKQQATTKKIIVDSSMSLEDPIVTAMTRNIIAADGMMWFPEGTDLPDSIAQRMRQPTGRMQPQTEVAVEAMEFDRLYPSPRELIKKKQLERQAARTRQQKEKQDARARSRSEKGIRKALAQSLLEAENNKGFSEAQKAEALKRKLQLKQQAALHKLKKRFASTEIAGEQQYGGDRAIPQGIWWSSFVTRRDDQTAFNTGVKDVRAWENLVSDAGVMDDIQQKVAARGEMVMINHFAPVMEKPGMEQAPVSLVEAGITMDGRRPVRKPRAPRDDRPHRVLLNIEPKPKQRRKRRPPKGPGKRALAMKDVHQTTSLELADDDAGIPMKKDHAPRNNYTIPAEDEHTLLIAVLIVRMLFCEADRKIRWDIVQRALPQHDMMSLKGRWPRVRDNYRKYLKRIEHEFEDMYLVAYENGDLPELDLGRPSKFDLPLHVQWFRNSFSMPRDESVPELPASRKTFDALYTVSEGRTHPWRNDYHNVHYTMGTRSNHFACYTYVVPVVNTPPENPTLEYTKSVIKANITTDITRYNEVRAFEILRALPEQDVDEAFYGLCVDKVITHKKEHRRAAPGRNYEIAEKFHLAMKRPIDLRIVAQAVKFDRTAAERFSDPNGNRQLELSPLMNDGSMTAILDHVESGIARLRPYQYFANKWGLIPGYKTRSMDKDLVNFKIVLEPTPAYTGARQLPAMPPIPGLNRSEVITPEGKVIKEAIPVWVDINNDVIKGMWLKAATAVLSLVALQAGVNERNIEAMMAPSLTPKEVKQVMQWMVDRGIVEERVVGGSMGGVKTYRTRSGFYLGMEGC